MQTQTTQTGKENNMSAIDRALAAAKARKAQRDALYGTSQSDETSPAPEKKASTPPVPKAKPSKPSAEDREAEKTKRDEARSARELAKAQKLAAEDAAKAARKAERDAAKAAKRAAKDEEKTSKKPAHMKKVDRARAKCPTLSGDAEALFGEIVANLSAQQIDALAQHLIVHNRAMATLRATQLDPLPLGATVRITGGEARFVGMMGEVVHSQKLRAKVQVPGVSKPVYIYNGQAEVVVDDLAVAAV